MKCGRNDDTLAYLARKTPWFKKANTPRNNIDDMEETSLKSPYKLKHTENKVPKMRLNLPNHGWMILSDAIARNTMGPEPRPVMPLATDVATMAENVNHVKNELSWIGIDQSLNNCDLGWQALNENEVPIKITKPNTNADMVPRGIETCGRFN